VTLCSLVDRYKHLGISHGRLYIFLCMTHLVTQQEVNTLHHLYECLRGIHASCLNVCSQICCHPLNNVWHPTTPTCHLCSTAAVGKNSFSKMFICKMFQQWYTVHYVINVLILQSWQRCFPHLRKHNGHSQCMYNRALHTYVNVCMNVCMYTCMYVHRHTHLHWKLLHPLAMCLLILSDRIDESQWACCRHIKAVNIFDSARGQACELWDQNFQVEMLSFLHTFKHMWSHSTF
jgi:hypothetical protein